MTDPICECIIVLLMYCRDGTKHGYPDEGVMYYAPIPPLHQVLTSAGVTLYTLEQYCMSRAVDLGVDHLSTTSSRRVVVGAAAAPHPEEEEEEEEGNKRDHS